MPPKIFVKRYYKLNDYNNHFINLNLIIFFGLQISFVDVNAQR